MSETGSAPASLPAAVAAPQFDWWSHVLAPIVVGLTIALLIFVGRMWLRSRAARRNVRTYCIALDRLMIQCETYVRAYASGPRVIPPLIFADRPSAEMLRVKLEAAPPDLLEDLITCFGIIDNMLADAHGGPVNPISADTWVKDCKIINAAAHECASKWFGGYVSPQIPDRTV